MAANANSIATSKEPPRAILFESLAASMQPSFISPMNLVASPIQERHELNFQTVC